MWVTDLFLFGAVQRTLSQSKAFRLLVESCNFASATILLRTQIDTAMRINGISLMADAERAMLRLQSGEVQFDRLTDGEGRRLTDAHLRAKLAEAYPWINAVYTRTSDFVHLSFSHLGTAIGKVDEESQTFTLSIDGRDPDDGDEGRYYDLCDAFLQASTMTSSVILGMFMLIHRREVVEAAHRREQADQTHAD